MENTSEFNPLKTFLEGGIDENPIHLTDYELEKIIFLSSKVLAERNNRGAYPERLNIHNPREIAFSEVWQKVNLPEAWINRGHGILQDLFINPNPKSEMLPTQITHEITNVERRIVATVIQWLGTNCGMAFLSDALKKCGFKIVKIENE